MLLAQITDSHIKAEGKLAYRRVDTLARLKDCVAHVNALSPSPDAVLMSGDLVDFGTETEYDLARPVLDKLTMPYFVVPGNHDDRDVMRRAFADHSYLPASGFLNYAIDDFPVRLVGLDSSVKGKPHGEMCVERLDWLETCLAQKPDIPTLLFMHHPPFLTGINHMDRQNCGNGPALGAVVERHRQVQMILCGHVHRAIETLFHGVIACIGPSPSHAVALDVDPNGPSAFALEPPAVRLVHLTAEHRLVTHLSFIGAFDGPHPFFDADGQLID